MKKTFLFFMSTALLCGCGKVDAPESSSMAEIAETTAAASTEGSNYRFDFPEEITEGRKEKIYINDIYVLSRSDEYLVIVDYQFKQCWKDEPTSFMEVYADSVFINGIETDHDYGSISGSEADYSTKLLGMSKASVKVGYKIKDYGAAKDKEFKLILNTRSNGTPIYEVSGMIGELRIEKE